MDDRTRRVLEYPALLAILARHASTSLGTERALALKPFAHRADVERALAETDEGRRLLDRGDGIAFGGVHDIRPLIERASVGAMLDPRDLLTVGATLSASRRLRALLNRRAGDTPLLADLGAQMGEFTALTSRIERSVTPDAQVADGASEALGRIRSAMHRQARRIQDTLQRLISTSSVRAMLQDPIIVARNGRYCLPVKAENRHAFGGLVHDQSASGQTLFMEPPAIVEAGNELRQLEFHEREEVERIMMEISRAIGQEARPIRASVTALAHLDLIVAKARLADAMRAERPTLSPSPGIDLTGARHPLLVWQALEALRENPKAAPAVEDAVVPIDLTLGHEFHSLLITGPNTGGKTVTLKTAGLMALMAQSGLHLPCAQARLGVFRNVFADIGDEQSLQQSLSTFSGHIRNIVRILNGARQGSLALLDELGAGTDPAEGAALAKALLLRLAQRGALTIATTHYAELKEFAWNNEGFQNASVEFDVETLRPTYRLRIGVPGASNAITIAGRLGMPEDVLEAARANLGQEHRAVEDAIARMEESERRARWAAAEAEKKARELEAQRRDAERELSDTRDRRREATERAYQEAMDVLQRAREEANALIRALREEQIEGKASTEARARLQRLEETVRQKRPKPRRKPTHRIAPGEPPAEGDAVWIPSLGATGLLVGIRRDEAVVQAGALRLTVPYATLEKVAEEMAPPKRPRPVVASPGGLEAAANAPTELHIRGLRADEALIEIDRYLDQARLAGLHSLRIIHGKGTGALRDLVQRFLLDQRDVKGFRLGKEGEGGDGATIVELA